MPRRSILSAAERESPPALPDTKDALMRRGNGSERTRHPVERFGENWRDWGRDYTEPEVKPTEH